MASLAAAAGAPAILPRVPRRRLVLALAAAAALLGLGAAAWALSSSGGGAGAAGGATAEQVANVQPLLVPRRRHPPRAVEPEAGVPLAEQQAPAPEDLPSVRVQGRIPPPPSDAQVKRELAQLDAAAAKYDFASLDFSGVLVGAGSLPRGGWRESIASVYTDYGLPIACSTKMLQPEQLGVAHKTLPCGTMVLFRYGDRAIRLPVIDRGPYIAGREWDFTGAAAAALKFPGLGRVLWTIPGG